MAETGSDNQGSTVLEQHLHTYDALIMCGQVLVHGLLLQ